VNIIALSAAVLLSLADSTPVHMDSATASVYARLKEHPGCLAGIGYLEHVGANGKWRLAYPMAMADWESRFGSAPACFEFELGEHRGRVHARDWFSAGIFARRGGLPVFALTMNNMSVPWEASVSGSAWDRRNGLYPVLPGGECHDSFVHYMRTLAHEFKSFGYPCIFRPFHEMNGMWFWWCGNPDGYRTLWREIFGIFREEGVSNVMWCWNPDWGRDLPDGFEPAIDYYPGDTYVDILALDMYFSASALPAHGARSIGRLARLSPEKPVFIAEFGPAARVDFWRSFAHEFEAMPRVKGIMFWMGRGWDFWGGGENGSLIDESTAAETREAFRAFLSSRRVLSLDRWSQP
jgi:hypothetical protein